MEKSALTVIAIVGIVTIAVLFSSTHTGLMSYNICPDGKQQIIRSIPGGGNQVVDCVDQKVIGGFGNTFNTYTNSPYGDLRRQSIAQKGYYKAPQGQFLTR